MHLEYRAIKSDDIFIVSPTRELDFSDILKLLILMLVTDRRRSDEANERLPEFNPNASATIFPVPSMRISGRRNSGDGDGMNMEVLIKKTLEEDEDDGGVVERLADRIARGRRVTGRPRALKRHETA